MARKKAMPSKMMPESAPKMKPAKGKSAAAPKPVGVRGVKGKTKAY